MSWLEPTQYEQALLQNTQHNWPDIVELAKYTVLCPSIEPLLLRNMRLRFLAGSEPELEHRLWFSALISARSTRNIILHHGVARLLAEQLQKEKLFDQVWKLTQNWTVQLNPLDRLEQQLRVSAFLNDQQQLNQGLQDILKLITQTEDEEERLNLARWTKRTLPAIATETETTEEIAWLAQYATRTLGATSSWTRLSSTAPLPTWLADTIPKSSAKFGQSKIGLQLRYDADKDYQVLECVAAKDTAMTLDLPTPLPARLYIQSENQAKGNWEVIDIGSRIKITGNSQKIKLCTIEGKRYQLQAEFAPDHPAHSNKPKTTKLYLAFVEKDSRIAKRIARDLKQQKVDVNLILEKPGTTAFERSQANNIKLLRLWTPTAQAQWSSIESDLSETSNNSLLLRMNQAPLPTGSNSTQIIDLDNTANLTEDIKQWLENTEPEANLSTQSQTDDLLIELENPDTQPRRRLEIGNLLAKMGDPRPGVGVKEVEIIKYPPEIRELLYELDDTSTLPPRRLEIGDQLAKLGDPRPGVRLNINNLPDIDWIKIPAGEFIYGEAKSLQTLTLDTFYISRYLITNSQFQAFIEAGGYQNKNWWKGLKKPNSIQPRWSQVNRARENIDWYETVAYTRWLTEKLGYEILLPTEQQWEKAARGMDGRKYPWGNEFQSGFANIDEKYTNVGEWYLEQTTAVGMYQPVSLPYPLSDMVGNVWEWCLNKYDSPKKIDIDSSGDMRVVRGGSWFDDPEDARCALRSWSTPDYRNFNIGFRVVCLSPYTAL